MPVAADEDSSGIQINDGAVAGERMSLEEQYRLIMANGSVKQKEEALLLYQQAKSGFNGAPYAIGHWELSVTHCEQEKGTWCGPATLRQTLLYINGTARDQSYLAGKLETDKTIKGTTDTMMLKQVNALQNEHAYYELDIPDKDTYLTTVYASLSSDKPVIDIVDTSAAREIFSYDALHFLSISGISTKNDEVFIVDPAVEDIRVDGHSRAKRWVEAEGMFNATFAHDCQAIIG
ncbi:MAG: hypothetical protein HFE44_05250 [Oscillospiraceae bacterium]|jgi:hypothetical protein|nr:hypothetical protein [Oscillospiraceae bacterium]